MITLDEWATRGGDVASISLEPRTPGLRDYIPQAGEGFTIGYGMVGIPGQPAYLSIRLTGPWDASFRAAAEEHAKFQLAPRQAGTSPVLVSYAPIPVNIAKGWYLTEWRFELVAGGTAGERVEGSLLFCNALTGETDLARWGW